MSLFIPTVFNGVTRVIEYQNQAQIDAVNKNTAMTGLTMSNQFGKTADGRAGIAGEPGVVISTSTAGMIEVNSVNGVSVTFLNVGSGKTVITQPQPDGGFTYVTVTKDIASSTSAFTIALAYLAKVSGGVSTVSDAVLANNVFNGIDAATKASADTLLQTVGQIQGDPIVAIAPATDPNAIASFAFMNKDSQEFVQSKIAYSVGLASLQAASQQTVAVPTGTLSTVPKANTTLGALSAVTASPIVQLATAKINEAITADVVAHTLMDSNASSLLKTTAADLGTEASLALVVALTNPSLASAPAVAGVPMPTVADFLLASTHLAMAEHQLQMETAHLVAMAATDSTLAPAAAAAQVELVALASEAATAQANAAMVIAHSPGITLEQLVAATSALAQANAIVTANGGTLTPAQMQTVAAVQAAVAADEAAILATFPAYAQAVANAFIAQAHVVDTNQPVLSYAEIKAHVLADAKAIFDVMVAAGSTATLAQKQAALDAFKAAAMADQTAAQAAVNAAQAIVTAKQAFVTTEQAYIATLAANDPALPAEQAKLSAAQTDLTATQISLTTEQTEIITANNLLAMANAIVLATPEQLAVIAAQQAVDMAQQHADLTAQDVNATNTLFSLVIVDPNSTQASKQAAFDILAASVAIDVTAKEALVAAEANLIAKLNADPSSTQEAKDVATAHLAAVNDSIVAEQNMLASAQSILIPPFMGDAGDNILDASASLHSETLDGKEGNDTLIGGAGNDALIGGAGNDSLNGGSGFDLLQGGAGNDIYVINDANSFDSVQENINEGTDTVQTNLPEGYAFSNIEKLMYSGTGDFSGYGNELDNVLIGNSGDDALLAWEGNDTLDGGAGDDLLWGGLGNDTYIVDSANDVAFEQLNQGKDTVISSIDFVLRKNIENLTLSGTTAINGTGNNANNVIIGNVAANILNGGLGSDTLQGGAGNDTYIVDNVGDKVIELALNGIDTVKSSVSYVLAPNVEKLTLTGTQTINGTGNLLANTIVGNAANNILNGGLGNDTLTGGAGHDTFVLGRLSKDVITDFSVVDDTIQLSSTIFAGGKVVDPSDFISGAGLTTAAGTGAFLIYNTTTGALYIDPDGGNNPGAAVQIAVIGVATHAALTLADFVVV